MTASKGRSPSPLSVGGEVVPPGETRQIEIPVARLPPTKFSLSIPVEVVHGTRSGPGLWLSGALHGDELNGVEIIRRVIEAVDPAEMKGFLLAVPIVNVFGFINGSRYLPDRRDLNRCFPGSSKGTLPARLADIFMKEIVGLCTHGIDFHTGSNHRTNLPQIRGNIRDAETRRCAEAFGAPVVIHAESRDGSLREAATRRGIHVLLFEGGEPLRFEESVIEAGVKGTLRVMRALGMLRRRVGPPGRGIAIATKTIWLRARASGLCRLQVDIGDRVERRQRLGTISDIFGEVAARVVSPRAGIVVGIARNPLIHQGEGLVHLATEFEDLLN